MPAATASQIASIASLTVDRIGNLLTLIDRAGAALDDIAELRKSAQYIAESIAGLADSAHGIDKNAGEIAREIEDLTKSAQGIDHHADVIARALPTVDRLVDIIDPLQNAVARFGGMVDRLPRSRRSLRQQDSPGG